MMFNPNKKTDLCKKMVDACINNYDEVEELIEEAKQADTDDKTLSSNETPFLAAAYEGHLNKLLNYNAPILTAAEHGKFDIVCLLLENGAEPNVQDVYGRGILYFLVEWACKEKQAGDFYLQKTKALFESGIKNGQPIKPNLPDMCGVTPAMYANINGQADLAVILFEHGAILTEAQRTKQAKLAHSKAKAESKLGSQLTAMTFISPAEQSKQVYEPPVCMNP
ncbi:MAG: hypothetical protein K0S29_846 [Gammaproteobacteria bacterium]|jgi:ankyrin repeat protein|nr:hypothetical protein [Gammaproteobacteria bacterium]